MAKIEYEPQSEVIESSRAISQLLGELKALQGPVAVQIDGCDKQLISQVLHVDEKRGLFTIDAFPSDLISGCHFGVDLSFNGWINGALIRFRTSMVVDTRLDGDNILIPFPVRAYYFQRRRHYRVDAIADSGTCQPHKVVLRCGERHQAAGRLNNISEGGIDFYLLRCNETIAPHQKIDLCEVHLFDEVIGYPIDVRHVSHKKDIHRIHARFLIPDKKEKHRLAKPVRAFERHLIQEHRTHVV